MMLFKNYRPPNTFFVINNTTFTVNISNIVITPNYNLCFCVVEWSRLLVMQSHFPFGPGYSSGRTHLTGHEGVMANKITKDLRLIFY